MLSFRHLFYKLKIQFWVFIGLMPSQKEKFFLLQCVVERDTEIMLIKWAQMIFNEFNYFSLHLIKSCL